MKEGARIMSLTDGTSKMSKSDPVDGSRINLTDSPDLITKKVTKWVRAQRRLNLDTPGQMSLGVLLQISPYMSQVASVSMI